MDSACRAVQRCASKTTFDVHPVPDRQRRFFRPRNISQRLRQLEERLSAATLSTTARHQTKLTDVPEDTTWPSSQEALERTVAASVRLNSAFAVISAATVLVSHIPSSTNVLVGLRQASSSPSNSVIFGDLE